ncbi:MAG: efflux RND transporter periplasmic adaptor subunit [Cryomorphaceae bacterium]|jgi:HlyD family secretion protein|nr:efflux RND transporter periplasmic adaptor subunit [Cryomorphaceae bacterium]MCO4775105.1 efflux RND transporter periplasmic adaptor subunit [Flavobacteriales bacterium]MDA7721741.1 efflux RND transporter periplasmic adaptor subunit [Schleiferiaceae bacterium]PTL97206.1 MAG: efflux RND transporter periplasmic adaptor subunit [Bacteroidota bacterium]MBL6682178.1 efflux RND transporter periplasmic adaptor subunit [Cryomorphaceae bacterium]
MKLNLKIIIPVAVIVIAALVVAKKKGWIGEGADTVAVETGYAHRRTVVESVTASGKIQPEVEVKMSPEVSGEIIEVNVVDGQQVLEGDILVKINPDLYESAITRARAAVNSSKAVLAQSSVALDEAKKLWARNKVLFEKGAISEQEYDAAQRAISVAELQEESAKYQLQSAEANLDEAYKNLKRTTIIAPINGTVTQLDVELGERVVGTATMTGTEMLRIADLNTMEVLVEVNENDIVKITKGDTAIIEVDAFLGNSFRGVVSEIANSAKLALGASPDQVTNFEVKIRMINGSFATLVPDYGENPFRPGMTATVEIITNKMRDALVVPIQAVTVRSDTSSNAVSYERVLSEDVDESFEVVFTPDGMKAGLLVVESGIQDDEFIIVTGVEDSTEVVTGPYSAVSRNLKRGTRITTDKK